MILSAQLIPLWLNVTVGVVMLVCVAAAALTANWPALKAASERQHVLLGGHLALLLLWMLTLEVSDGLSIHLLGVTTLTLIVGWRFTIVGSTMVLLGYLLLQGQSLLTAPLGWLFSVLVPATVTRSLAIVLRRYAFRNLFVYLLGAGFGGGLLSILALILVALPVFWLIGQTDWVLGAVENWPFIPLLMFPEGFINGMLVTAFTVFYPEVVKTFDDDYYLNG